MNRKTEISPGDCSYNREQFNARIAKGKSIYRVSALASYRHTWDPREIKPRKIMADIRSEIQSIAHFPK